MQIAALIPTLEEDLAHHYEFRENHHFSPDIQRKSLLLAAILPAITGFGSIYQAFGTARDQRLHLPPGIMVEIEGSRIHMQTAGSGFPSVVLETGLGGMSSAWGWIQPETAKFSRTLSYDRAGLGWSDPDSSIITAAAAARRLHDILTISRVLPPYVLVGHSMGGLHIRVFAALYPDEVAGMVLLDGSHPDQHLRSGAINEHMRSGFRYLKAVPLLARLGYVRLTGFFDSWAEGLPRQQAAEAKAFLSNYRHLRTTYDESNSWDTFCDEVRGTKGLGDIPLAVVTAGRDVLPGQPELQRELAGLSSDSVHVVVNGADHVSLITRHEHAMMAVKAIRHVVERVKNRRSLGV